MFIRRYKWPLLSMVILGIIVGFFIDETVYGGRFRKKIFGTSLHLHHTPPSFAIVDMARIHEESSPFKALHAFLETRYSKTEQQIFDKENELRQEHKELSEQEKMLTKPDEELATRRQEFQQKVQDLERDVLEKKKHFNEQFQGIKIKLEIKLQEIIRSLAEEKGINIVLNRSLGPDAPLILFASDTFDLTQEIIDHLDTTHLELTIPTD